MSAVCVQLPATDSDPDPSHATLFPSLARCPPHSAKRWLPSCRSDPDPRLIRPHPPALTLPPSRLALPPRPPRPRLFYSKYLLKSPPPPPSQGELLTRTQVTLLGLLGFRVTRTQVGGPRLTRAISVVSRISVGSGRVGG